MAVEFVELLLDPDDVVGDAEDLDPDELDPEGTAFAVTLWEPEG